MNLSDLNPSQRDAVVCCDAPSLVIAGAGSGKTRVLTYKIAYLLEQGMEPWSILALTFTNKAAREMQQRISQLVGADRARYLWMGTFHSIFSRILRTECSALGFDSNFTIYDAADSKNLIKTIVREMQLDEKTYKPGLVASYISAAKNALMLPSAYATNPNVLRRDSAANVPATSEIYRHYYSRCRQSNAMDFDDLLLYTWQLFRDHPDVLQKYQQRFAFVLVDEYQDTNYAQHQIVWQLTSQHQRVCVVGDDAQSIYSFRGANIDNILNFQSMYTGARLFKLEENYRSTQTIVSAANSLIHHNNGQIRKNVYSQQDVGQRIQVCKTYSDYEEASLVSRKIRSLYTDKHLSYSQIAILYRTNAQSRNIEEALLRMNIPYRIYGGLSFYQRKEIKDVLAYFRMAINPHDEEALKRIINYPARGIGDTTVRKIFAAASLRQQSAWDVLLDPQGLDVNRGILGRLQTFVQLIQDFAARIDTDDAHSLAIDIVKQSGIQGEIFHGKEPDDISRQENLQELIDGIQSFCDERVEQGLEARMVNYLQEVSLLSDLDQDDPTQEDKVTLMTVHSAKGLEFGAVIVVGMEENLFPSQMSLDSPRQIEEERRLFYVAMTRAQHYLILTYATSRYQYGKMEFSNPSRFLSEIDPHYLIQGDASPSRPTSPIPNRTSPIPNRTSSTPVPIGSPMGSHPTSPLPGEVRAGSPRLTRITPTTHIPHPSSSIPNQPSSLPLGTRIAHERFGEGTVINIEGTGLDTKATIQFDNSGTKVLLLRFAKLQVL